MEKQLVRKTYYKLFMKEGETREPVEVLGEAFHREQMKDTFDLTYIRFAQGEIYYHNKDHEAAIYKWEIVNNELEPWAKKNIGDAYLEAGMLTEAEKMYSTIETDNKVLSIETAMKLIALYAERNNIERVYETIHRALDIDPDYPYVTETARTFYEDQRDWKSAVQLAVNEALRTESLSWYEILTEYIANNCTKDFSPDYFLDVLLKAAKIEQQLFASLLTALWGSYRNKQWYLDFVMLLNEVLEALALNNADGWTELTSLHHECYLDLLDGQFTVTELQPVVPRLLKSWLQNAQKKTKLFPSAAVMAWSEVFPESLEPATLRAAEKYLFQDNTFPASSPVDDSLQLYDALRTWAGNNNLASADSKKSLAKMLANPGIKNVLVTGTVAAKVSAVMKLLAQEKTFDEENPSWFFHGEQQPAAAIVGCLATERFPIKPEKASASLEKSGCTAMYLPQISAADIEAAEIQQLLKLADGMLYVIDPQEPFLDRRLTIIRKIHEHTPSMPIHFVIHSMDQPVYDNEIQAMIKTIKENVSNRSVKIVHLSSLQEKEKNRKELFELLQAAYPVNKDRFIAARAAKILDVIRVTLTELHSGREVKETSIKESMNFDSDILRRLKGLNENLRETESEHIRSITDSYRAVKNEMMKEIRENIPKLLRQCADGINEESDFRHLHEQLNDTMNEKIKAYFEEMLVPAVRGNLRHWLASVQKDLLKTQQYLQEMGNSFNSLYGQEKVKLRTDDRVVEDWRRDIQRMTNRIEVEENVNIMNRTKPAQLLLKGAGKLLSGLQKNKALLFKQYKKYLESESYAEVCDSLMKPFLLEFDLFEKALRADVKLFFESTFDELRELIASTEQAIENGKLQLSEMENRPEVFFDPLQIFEVRLLQLDFIVKTAEDYPVIRQMSTT
ncbi:hypothetical protein SAMN05421736_101959 [Evansella caseinilytica]|uniref:Uncharacterized protein n=1 Tax=Evansella caseinilytica TaxID=1503961 RepID=A0A1H3IY07_9BACI|nr:hypothetical protein [Evansella caseinilytica]SDY32532.1 hypothetical protein SAMN05421736_101959 [Evansella caseinilytica]